MRENTRSPQKKVLAAGVAVALGAGIVGVGANLDYVTSIIGNQFQGTVADPDKAPERDNALLVVEGDAIDYEFDVEANNDMVTAEWVIKNIGGYDAVFAADFLPAASIDQVLAENLEIFYTVDGTERRAGTLADSRELTDLMGIPTTLAIGEELEVSVRVVLPNPGDLLTDGNDIDDLLNVVADWNVNYMTSETPEPEPEPETQP